MPYSHKSRKAERTVSMTGTGESRQRFSRFKRRFAKQFKKRLSGSVEPFAAAMNNSQRAKEAGTRKRDWYHAALGDIGVHDAGRHNTHAGAVRHRFLNHLKVVEMKNRVDQRAMIAKEPVDISLDGKILIETDKLHPVEIRRRHFRARGERVPGRSGHHHLFFAPGNHGDIARWLGVTHQAEVGAIGRHRFIDLFGPQILDFEARLRTAPLKFALELRHLRQPDRIDGRNPNSAFGCAVPFVERGSKFVIAAQDIAAKFEVDFARFGNDQRAGSPIQKHSCKRMFQLL